MKKFMRIALVFALAGAALVGCTKDYSGDISDLNKEVSAIQSTLTSLQTSIQGAQSAADAAAATANTALSAAKAAATADDLKAVQTALAAAATSADLTAVDAKYAAYIPAIEAAAKASDLEALETAITAAIAATDVKVADLEKALEAYAKKADLDEAVKKLGELETNYIDLEARVAKLEAAEKEIRDLIDANAKDIEINAKAIEDLQKLVEELTAQVEGNFNVTAISSFRPSTYSFAKWNPGTTKAEKALFAKMVEEFPKLAEIERGENIESFGALSFIVNPSSVVLDDTYSFSLVNKKGEDNGIVLGNPTLGYNVKAGANVWNVEVQSPAYDKDGKPVYDWFPNLSLVVENAEGISAQTAFEYKLLTKNAQNDKFEIVKHNFTNFVFKDGNSFDAFETYEVAENNTTTEHAMFSFPEAPLYDDYFIIEADAADVEKYGIEYDGSVITFNKIPVGKADEDGVDFTITAVGVNGTTAQVTANFKFSGAVAPNAELAAKEVTLGYDKTNGHKVFVDYAVADFGFSALEWKTIYKALVDNNGEVSIEGASFADANVSFLTASGKSPSNYSDAATMRVTVNSDNATALPGTYEITISDDKVFCAVGELTLVNPETCPVKLIDALCDANGVLQIVGDVETKDGFITYGLINALVYDSNEAGIYSKTFSDDDRLNDNVDNWVKDGETFQIPVQGKTWGVAGETEEQELLYTERNFSVNFKWFKAPTKEKPDETENYGVFEFKAQAVSPIWAEGGKDVIAVSNPTIYLGGQGKTTGEYKSFNVNTVVNKGIYVAGDNVDKEYNIFNVWTEKVAPGPDAVYRYYKTNASYDAPNTGDNFTPNTNYAAIAGTASTKYVLDDEGEVILYTDFAAKYLKLFNSTITQSEILTIQEYARGEHPSPLYLSNGMFIKLSKHWAKYYDEFGNERKITTKDGKTIYFVTYNTISGNSYEIFKADVPTKKLNQLTAAFGCTDAQLTAVPVRTEDEKTAIELFDKYKNQIRHFEEPAGDPTNYYTISERADEIQSVKVGFVDSVSAAKFIDDVTEITDPYSITSGPSCSISVKNEAKFEAGLTKVDLPAYIKVADKWGMTMEIPFTVTVKVASR